MSLPIWILSTSAGVATLSMALRTWWKWRGNRVVKCPENQRPAGVTVATGRAVLHPFQPLTIATCSRWPEHPSCRQECLHQITSAPGDSLVRNILVGWYAGKQCACCGQPFEKIPAVGALPAILLADKRTIEWAQIPADRLHQTLDAAVPICFACHLGNTLVREHPELVVDRHRLAERSARS